MENILNEIRTHRQEHLEQLFQLLRIPSVSTDPACAGDVARCSQVVAELLQSAGMKTVEILPTEGHPVVYAEWLEAPNAPTILLYGHYDVQPPDPLDLWESPPFAPELREGEIYARGASDDKGQIFAHIKAIEAHFKQNGRLPVNLKLLLEGEEEIGSAHLHAFVEHYARRLQADAILISDTTMFAPGCPTICYGTRGLVGAQIDVQGPSHDLHSGAYGGIVANPIQVLAEILTALKDRHGRITIPGFYDDVEALDDAEKQQFEALPAEAAALRQETGVPELSGEPGYSLLERRWTRPTLDVNGISGGFTGEGSKTIIPARAMAKVTMRLVPNQSPDKILQAFTDYVQHLTPSYVHLSISHQFGVVPYVTPLDHPVMPIIADSLHRVFGRAPFFVRSGGTIGVVGTFAEVLNAPVVFVGLSQPNDNAHSPNEHLTEEAFYTGIEVAAQLLHDLQTWQPRSS